MARGIIRKPSFNKIVGAYRSQWKRFWMRLFTFGIYGSKGVGWWRDPKRAWYNFWYYRTSVSVYKLLGYKPSRGACFFACLFASAFSVIASPVDATRAGVKAHKIKTERKNRAKSSGNRSSSKETSSRSSTHIGGASAYRSQADFDSSNGSSGHKYSSPVETTSAPRSSTMRTPKAPATSMASSASTPKTTTRNTSSATKKSPMTATPKKTTTASYKEFQPTQEDKPKSSYSYTPIYAEQNIKPQPVAESEAPKEPDENMPKSKPKHEQDQYIRKRMFIAGSSYCDASVLEKLSVGTYFDLVAEPDNPYDKDAVMLTFEGEKIGYIAKTDRLAFVTCLKLKRKIYGVITAIDNESKPSKYEFETWFDQHKQDK